MEPTLKMAVQRRNALFFSGPMNLMQSAAISGPIVVRRASFRRFIKPVNIISFDVDETKDYFWVLIALTCKTGLHSCYLHFLLTPACVIYIDCGAYMCAYGSEQRATNGRLSRLSLMHSSLTSTPTKSASKKLPPVKWMRNYLWRRSVHCREHNLRHPDPLDAIIRNKHHKKWSFQCSHRKLLCKLAQFTGRWGPLFGLGALHEKSSKNILRLF